MSQQPVVEVNSAIIRIIGVIIAILGVMLILAALGVDLGVHVPASWLVEGLVGLFLVLLGASLTTGWRFWA